MGILDSNEKDGCLKTAFKVAAAAAVTPPLALLYGTYSSLVFRFQAVNTLRPNARLTEEESALIKSIFGKKINTKRIKIYFDSGKSEGARPQTLGPRKIKVNSSKHYETDYSRTKDSDNYNTFIHEMTHVWQQRHSILHAANTLRAVYQLLRHSSQLYAYNLSPERRFKDFGIEQQACIIGDYARQFLFDGTGKPKERSYMPPHGSGRYQDTSLLQKVVEDRFPEARKTRLALEAKAKAGPKLSTPKLNYN